MMLALIHKRRCGENAAEPMATYRAALEVRWEREDLSPSSLLVFNTVGLGRVQPGDILCCSCSAKDALAGKCHRAWAAPFLVRAGWDVVLDGQPFTLSEKGAPT
jgi:hypothetical protein